MRRTEMNNQMQESGTEKQGQESRIIKKKKYC